MLNALPSNKATGPDGIGNFILNSISKSLSQPLCKLFNFSNVSPIHKKNNRNDIRNYRPISLLTNISKVFEKLIYKPVYEYFTHNKFFNDKNSGFRKETAL